MPHHFDATVIGTGQAGPPLAQRLSRAGLKVAVVERGRFGGTCVNTGCTPTKTLVASAYAAHTARRAAEYGIIVGGQVAVDMKKIKARKDAVTGEYTKGVEASLRSLPNCTVIQGHARFVSPREIEVGTERSESDLFFINVGGRAIVPPIPGLDQVGYFTNSSMVDVDVLPPHLLVLGGSYVGLEFAQMYRRFGSAVTVIETSPRLTPREDEDISDAIRDILESEGIAIRLGSTCKAVAKRGDVIVATLDTPSGPAEVVASHLLVATGRRPNTDDLGVDAAGIKLDERGFIPTDDELRTVAPTIFALGDCNGRGAFTHTSYNDQQIVAANLLGHEHRKVTDRIPTYGLFIDPPLGRIGMSEREAREAGRRILVGKRPMTRVSRAIEKGETKGLMKVVVDAETRKILGTAILGTGGDEAVHCITSTMYAGCDYTTLQRAVHIHPTVSELVPTILDELAPA